MTKQCTAYIIAKFWHSHNQWSFIPGHSVSHEGLKNKENCHKDAENEDSLCMQSASQKQN